MSQSLCKWQRPPVSWPGKKWIRRQSVPLHEAGADFLHIFHVLNSIEKHLYEYSGKKHFPSALQYCSFCLLRTLRSFIWQIYFKCTFTRRHKDGKKTLTSHCYSQSCKCAGSYRRWTEIMSLADYTWDTVGIHQKGTDSRHFKVDAMLKLVLEDWA